MARQNELEISINPDGEVSIKVIASKGKKCLDLTKDLEEALGIVTQRETKPQFYENDTNNSSYINTGLN